MEKGLKTAISVPLSVMHTANECWDAMVEMAKVGNIATISDMQVSLLVYRVNQQISCTWRAVA